MTQSNNNYLIKEGDRFLIFDINDKINDKLQKLSKEDILKDKEITDFLQKLKMFHQSSIDSPTKEGAQIIEKSRFKELLTKDADNNDPLLKNAYIIKIIKINPTSFEIEAFKLNNKLEIEKLQKEIDNLEDYIKKNTMRINKDCYDINYNIIVNNFESEDIKKKYTQLDKSFEQYKNDIKDIKQLDIEKIEAVDLQLINKLTSIKEDLKISKPYTINEPNEPINKLKNYNYNETVTVGNENLLKLIKSAINNTTSSSSNSMIFKIEVGDTDIYSYKEYINKYTPYSAYNKLYILLDLYISSTRYSNLSNY